MSLWYDLGMHWRFTGAATDIALVIEGLRSSNSRGLLAVHIGVICLKGIEYTPRPQCWRRNGCTFFTVFYCGFIEADLYAPPRPF